MNHTQLEKLFEQTYQRAYRAAKSICFSRQLAEDAVSEALVRLLRAAEKGAVRADAEHYFLKITVNEAKRICSKRREILSEDVTAYLDAQNVETPAGREDAQTLLEAVNRLDKKLGLPIKLHYYGGFSEVETARLLGISYSAVKARMMRGRKKLKEMLEKNRYEEGGVHNEI